MDIKTVVAEFKVTRREDHPGISELRFAFAGRSNTGKSSLINRILRRKKLAVVSKQPGRTRAIHYYKVNDAFYVVDLPGFGYASMSKGMAQKLQELLYHYLESLPPTRFFLLSDIRRTLGEEEKAMIETCMEESIPITLLLTKADKVKRSAQSNALKKYRDIFGSSVDVIPVSSVSGEGIRDLWRMIKKEI